MGATTVGGSGRLGDGMQLDGGWCTTSVDRHVARVRVVMHAPIGMDETEFGVFDFGAHCDWCECVNFVCLGKRANQYLAVS